MCSDRRSSFSVRVIREAGYDEALLGLSLSYGQTWDAESEMGRLRGHEVMLKLSGKDGGHNKSLEAICVWLDVTASLKMWKQIDTYRIGVSKQSESTMHTILRRPLEQSDFSSRVKVDYLEYLNYLVEEKKFEKLTDDLPSSFLQRRIVTTNYKSLRGIYGQRKRHKLPEWKHFCGVLDEQLKYPEFLR